ncbi:hypothetical protein ACP70R_022570 [Stipagrostis hirtigluma subsp. patula]
MGNGHGLAGARGGDGSYDFHLRSLSAVYRDSAAAADPASEAPTPTSSNPCGECARCAKMRRRRVTRWWRRRPAVPGDEQTVPAMHCQADAGHGLRRRAAIADPYDAS